MNDDPKAGLHLRPRAQRVAEPLPAPQCHTRGLTVLRRRLGPRGSGLRVPGSDRGFSKVESETITPGVIWTGAQLGLSIGTTSDPQHHLLFPWGLSEPGVGT